MAKRLTRNTVALPVWTPEGFTLGSYRFIQNFGADIGEVTARYPDFILMKDRRNVEGYLSLLARRRAWRSLLELGIMKGGSCAFFNTLARPKLHLAIDLHRQPCDIDLLAVDAEAEGRRFVARFGVSQTDTASILDIHRESFGEEPIFDLVIDDASHDYALSLASFNGLFPHVSPGGVYAIEDWGWAHWGGPYADPAHPSYAQPALSNLVLRCVLGVTGGGGVIEDVLVTPNVAFVMRGQAPIPPNFDIERLTPLRGRPATLL